MELPAAIGAEVQHYLAVPMLTGPVIALPGTPRRWLRLTESADDSAPVNLVRLRARGALTHRCGTLVPLSPSRLESGVVTWHVPPSLDGPSLPPSTAVVAAARAVTKAGRSGVITAHRAREERVCEPMCAETLPYYPPPCKTT